MVKMHSKRIVLSTEDGIARIVLSRPDSGNAIDLEFAQELEVVANQAEVRRARVVVISALGNQFCVGGDLRSFSKERDLSSHLQRVTSHLHAGIAQLASVDAPLIVVVNGVAAGAGLGLVCAADLVIAGTSSTFLMAYTRLGLTPDGATSWYLARHIGLRRAIELSLTNRILSAREALEWGVITQVVDDEKVTEVSESMINRLATGPTGAFGATKRLLNSAADDSLHEHLALESDTMSARAQTGDAREGIAAFLERRDPVFTGE